uniref:Fibronectin type-III domain-containing protein n=1 Tax=Salmo trutta TaxID=8032 RepID=A0A674CG28_SALTR
MYVCDRYAVSELVCYRCVLSDLSLWSRQVILVQVNPGETFTIRAEDGSLQCIQGPAEVPMMSPNGSIPPIHVPPGYISQVLEDNTGVRRVVVTPQSPECYPPSYSPALSPTHHLPPYLTHPHFIPNSHSFYPPVSPGDLPPHQYYQHHLPPIYGEGKIPTPQPKTCLWVYEILQPILEIYRQLERQNRLNSPPSSLYKSLGSSHNGYRSENSPGGLCVCVLSNVCVVFQVSNVHARGARLSWAPPVGLVNRFSNSQSLTYEVSLSDKGRDGKYRLIYR